MRINNSKIVILNSFREGIVKRKAGGKAPRPGEPIVNLTEELIEGFAAMGWLWHKTPLHGFFFGRKFFSKYYPPGPVSDSPAFGRFFIVGYQPFFKI